MIACVKWNGNNANFLGSCRSHIGLATLLQPCISHGCTKRRNLEMEPKYLMKYQNMKRCRFLNPNIMRAKNDKNTVKSTIIMNFTGSSDVLCLQQSFKEKLEFTSEFWVFPLLREV